jgi:hypothetical protein
LSWAKTSSLRLIESVGMMYLLLYYTGNRDYLLIF